MIVSATADILGFSCATVSRDCREWCEEQKTKNSEQKFCGTKRIVNERGQRRRARRVKAGNNTDNHALQQFFIYL